MYWGRVCLLSRDLNNPITTVLWLVWVGREVRLLRVVAVMMVEMRAALNWLEIDSTISIILRVWGSPYLALLGSSGSFILVGEAMLFVSSLC